MKQAKGLSKTDYFALTKSEREAARLKSLLSAMNDRQTVTYMPSTVMSDPRKLADRKRIQIAKRRMELHRLNRPVKKRVLGEAFGKRREFGKFVVLRGGVVISSDDAVGALDPKRLKKLERFEKEFSKNTVVGVLHKDAEKRFARRHAVVRFDGSKRVKSPLVPGIPYIGKRSDLSAISLSRNSSETD